MWLVWSILICLPWNECCLYYICTCTCVSLLNCSTPHLPVDFSHIFYQINSWHSAIYLYFQSDIYTSLVLQKFDWFCFAVVKLQMQTLFYFLNLLDSLSIVLYVFSCELIAHLNKGQAEFFWCKNMFHRPLFYIVSLYTCVTLSDFLIHKKFIFQVDKSTSTNRKKNPNIFLHYSYNKYMKMLEC